MYHQAGNLVRNWTYFVIMHANVGITCLQLMMRKNLITGEEDAVPPGACPCPAAAVGHAGRCTLQTVPYLNSRSRAKV